MSSKPRVPTSAFAIARRVERDVGRIQRILDRSLESKRAVRRFMAARKLLHKAARSLIDDWDGSPGQWLRLATHVCNATGIQPSEFNRLSWHSELLVVREAAKMQHDELERLTAAVRQAAGAAPTEPQRPTKPAKRKPGWNEENWKKPEEPTRITSLAQMVEKRWFGLDDHRTILNWADDLRISLERHGASNSRKYRACIRDVTVFCTADVLDCNPPD